jgi:hypothetical protein
VLLADRTILHLVVELKLSIELGRDIHVGDGESALLAAERSRRVLLNSVLDALVSESPLGKAIALSERVGALPSVGEVEVTVVGDISAILEIGPVETTLLLVGTLVLAVVGSLEIVVEVPCSRYVCSSETGEYQRVLHRECDFEGSTRIDVGKSMSKRCLTVIEAETCRFVDQK